MTRAVAINVGANTNEPGFRGPIYPDGSFEFVPIPERAATVDPVPTYGDLELSIDVSDVTDVPVHLDPEFPEIEACERYTYGDPYPVKARPLLELQAGDQVLFYATLTSHGDDAVEWITPDWGAYLIGRFELARDPIAGEEFRHLSDEARAAFANNAHVKRETFDAAVVLLGDPDRSALFETAIPLSAETGATPNDVVTGLSTDSGKGPWWRRPLRFDEDATDELLALEDATASELSTVLGP